MNHLKLTKQETRTFLILLAGCLLSTLLVLPYAISLTNVAVPSWSSLLLGSFVNGLILYPIPIYLGMRIKRQTVLAGAPYLEGKAEVPWKSFLLWSITLGLLCGLLIIGADVAMRPWVPELAKLDAQKPNALYGFMASFYGGITEEVSMRLFLMTLLVWPLQKLGKPGIWATILLIAIVFGLGHLPATAQALKLSSVAALSAPMVVRAIALNGIAGVACGWLYWKKGLEYAILCHFTADICLHVVPPLIR